MATIKHYIKLSRPFTLLAPVIGYLCGAVMAWRAEGGGFPAAVWLGAAAAALINAFSNSLNQIYDIEIDRINQPGRPLPSAALTMKQAGVFTAVSVAAALALAALVNLYLLAIFAAAAFSTWLYSAPPARTKTRGLWANVTIAFPRGVLIMVAGWAAVTAPDSADPWAAGGVLALFVFGAASTKDFADTEGDRANGVKTLPIIYGPATAAKIIAPFLIVPFLFIPAIVAAGALDSVVLPLTALALYGAFVSWKMIKQYSNNGAASTSRSVWIHMYLLLMLAQIGFAVCYWLWA